MVDKETETLEELCDEFVVVSKTDIGLNPKLYTIDYDKLVNQYLKSKKTTIVYGAIWTGKGLIYVAKMNNEGKLELF